MKNRHDYYYKKAKEENYAARSVYKLEEAQKKFNFLKKTDRVLDVGCSPGSWSKYLVDKIITAGSVVGIDILPCKLENKRFRFMLADVEETKAEDLLEGGAMFDVVISDAMPNTTADKDANHFRSIGLAEIISSRLPYLLKEGGAFYIKVYDGHDFPDYRLSLTKYFTKVKVFKPKSSRDESRELFIYAEGFVPNGREGKNKKN